MATQRRRQDDHIAAGFRFGLRTVVSGPLYVGYRRYYVARCDFGHESRVRADEILRQPESGCRKCVINRLTRLNTKHGKSSSNEYRIWVGMIVRCHSPENDAYPNYGGRGITVCEAWRGAQGFERFLADVGPRPSRRHVLDRTDNNGNYEPGNVQWVTPKVSARNTRRCVMLEYKGIKQPVAAWAEALGMKAQVIRWRLNHRWAIEDVFNTPVVKGQKPHGRKGIANEKHS